MLYLEIHKTMKLTIEAKKIEHKLQNCLKNSYFKKENFVDNDISIKLKKQKLNLIN